MKHYQKLTLIILKIVGVLTLLYGAIGAAVSGLFLLLTNNPYDQGRLEVLQSANYIILVILGVVVSVAAEIIANSVCHFLENSDELSKNSDE